MQNQRIPASSLPDGQPAVASAEHARIADATRDDGRKSDRDILAEWGYEKPIPRHMRFELEEGLRKQGYDYFWAATKIAGMPNPRLGEYLRGGWRPVRAGDYRKLAGIDMKIDQRLVDLGFLKLPSEDDPIVDGDLMLCYRPMILSQQSRRNDKYEADKALFDRTEVLRQMSNHAIGDKTIMKRTVTYGVPPDQLPDDGV